MEVSTQVIFPLFIKTAVTRTIHKNFFPTQIEQFFSSHRTFDLKHKFESSIWYASSLVFDLNRYLVLYNRHQIN